MKETELDAIWKEINENMEKSIRNVKIAIYFLTATIIFQILMIMIRLY